MENNTAQLQKVEIKTNPAYLLQLAIEKGVDVQQLEKLLALQERWQKTQAEKEFNLAMSNFQKNCPVIKKKNAVKGKDGKERYKFAKIGDIVAQTKDEISANKLFYDFKTEDSKEFMKIICTVTHEAGHSKSTDFTIPIGTEDYMTDVQKYGARLSFGKRYAFCNAFGITTGDNDTDSIETEKPTDDQELNDLKELFCLKEHNLKPDEAKRAKKIISSKEKTSYGKLRNFLSTK